jgi:membrane dipeptidase
VTSTHIPVFDGHNDTLLSLLLPERGQGRSFFERSETGHIDLPRALEGGFAGGLFAIFVPNPEPFFTEMPTEPILPPPVDTEYASAFAMRMAAKLFEVESEANGGFQVVRNADELEDVLEAGRMAAVLHFEGAEPIDEELAALEVWYHAGLRSLGPVWSRPNRFATGVPFDFPGDPDIGPGLSEAGERLVKRCNELGIMLDLSHLNAAGFWDVARISDAPLVASHSNVHALCASRRNLKDDQLKAIRDSNGLVGLNFGVGFLHPEGGWDAIDLSLDVLIQHLDYLLEHLGETRVAIGSDFDGAPMPAAIGDAAGLPRLIEAMRASGYGEELIRKIAHENWVRVLRQTWGG